MEKERVFKIPDELQYAPKEIKEAYKEGWELDQKIQDIAFNTVVLADRHGEPIYINCNAVYAQNVKRMKRLGLTDPNDFKLVEERSKEMKDLQRLKGHQTKIVNGYMTGNQMSNVTDWKKQDILEQFGEYKNVDQVLEWMKDQGLPVQRGKLVKLYQDNLDDIKDRRLRFLSRSKEYYLATETGRIESLSYLYSQTLTQWEKTKNRGYISEARSIIEQVRKEVKGDEIRLTVNGQIDFTATIQANRSLADFMTKIPINMFIVSLVAGKKGVNPQDIMAQLTSSFYRRWNGFSELASEDEEIKLPSHYIKDYNWEEINRKHKDKDEQATNMVFHKKLEDFFKKNGVAYSGNAQEALQQFRKVCGGEAVSEIVDVKPLEINVVEEKEYEMIDKRQHLLKVLKMRQQQINNNGKDGTTSKTGK